MKNFLRINQSVFKYIDSLESLEDVEAATKIFSAKQLKRTFWETFETYFNSTSKLEKRKAKLKCSYINRCFGSGIPLNKKINRFVTPHAFYGIFISEDASIGKGCTIYQYVTIGSNTLPDSKNAGAPTIGDNVFIGAGAKIIGNVKIGNNVRIGAGCCVTRDVPDNCTVVQAAPIVIQKKSPQENKWLSISAYRKAKAAEKADNTSPCKK